MKQPSRHSVKQQQALLREELIAQGLSVDQIAAEMSRKFRLRPRGAYRVAVGWTQDIAAERYNRTAADCGLDTQGAASMDAPRISNIEVWPQGGRRPTLPVLRVLAQAYGTEPEHLVDVDDRRAMPPEDLLLLADMSRPPASAVVHEAAVAQPVRVPSDLLKPIGTAPRRSASEMLAVGPLFTHAASWDGSAMASLRVARCLIDRTLATQTVTHGQLDQLAHRMRDHRARYVVTPPALVLPELLADVLEAQSIAADRQPGLVQLRLSENIALLATLVADALMKLGAAREAAAWHQTARAAAEDTGNPELQARTLVQAAMLPYYFATPEDALTLAHAARGIAGSAPSATATMAAAAEARAAARAGDESRAWTAMADAQALFEATLPPLPEADTDAFGFPERRLLLYLSGAFTYLGDIRKARDVQRQALALYSHGSGIDPALLRLDEAVCYVQEHALSDACQLAVAALEDVQPEHRTLILDARAQHVLDEIPARLHASPAARELRDALALPASRASDHMTGP